MSNDLKVSIDGGIKIVRFTNPGIRNPLSKAVLQRLHAIVEDCREPLVFTGSDGVFASGANLREISALNAETAPEFGRYGQRLMTKISNHALPTAAAINGFCFGGALDLALSCRYRIAAPNARFAHPGAGLGIITGWGGTQRLPRLVGTAAALQMFFTAEPIDCQRAMAIGLADEVAANPLERALEIVRRACEGRQPKLEAW
jgi:enoyl-CoA hydratase